MGCHVGHDVDEAARLLRAGRLVAFPTETVYGLGADAFNTRAVAGVFAAKERPEFDPLIVHLASAEQLPRVVLEIPRLAKRLIDACWPGPLTLVLPKRPNVPDLVTAGLPGVAVRVPAHPLAHQLLLAVDRPVVAPSANPFGRISPTTAAHVAEGLAERVDYILDGGPCVIGVESTVISFMQDAPLLLRPGGTTRETVTTIIGPVQVPEPASLQDDASPQVAPGMLLRHYAPTTPLRIVAAHALTAPPKEHRWGLLAFQDTPAAAWYADVEILAPSGDLREAAANFFAALRRLDGRGLDLIVATPFPSQGLGLALNDRLKRAAAR